MFQFPAFPSYTLLYSCMDNLTFSQVEFPHSDIHESKDICSSSWLFAAYHVLLRLLVPRHSPYALSSLTSDFAYASLYCVILHKNFLNVLMYYFVNFCSNSLYSLHLLCHSSDMAYAISSANFSFLECFRFELYYYCMISHTLVLPSSSIYIFFNVLFIILHLWWR